MAFQRSKGGDFAWSVIVVQPQKRRVWLAAITKVSMPHFDVLSSRPVLLRAVIGKEGMSFDGASGCRQGGREGT
jgi:hypothetical protein